MESKVFHAYTADGVQFDGTEAPDAPSAREAIEIAYRRTPTFERHGKQCTLIGFTVREVPVPVQLHRDVEYWARRALLVPIGGHHDRWAQAHLNAALDAQAAHLFKP